MNLHFESFACFAVGLILLYSSGLWLTLLFRAEAIRNHVWAWSPLFGMVALTTVVGNLNYAGVSVRVGAPITVVILASLSAIFVARELRTGGRIGIFCRPFAVAVGAALFFMAPYAFTGAFPFLGDEFTYVSIADFLATHGYFGNTEPAHVYPWQSQMLLYQLGHLRMGAQYFLSICSSLFYQPAVVWFVPVTTALLFLMSSGFWVLASMVLPVVQQRWIALFIFAFNLMNVYWPAALNLMPQTSGLALMLGFFAAMIAAVLREPQMGIAAGLMLSGVYFHYSEILPLVVLCGIAYAGVLLVSRTISIMEGARLLYKVAFVSILVNPYTAYYSILAILIQLKSRPGFAVNIPFINYARMAFGLVGLVELHPVLAVISAGVSLVLLAVAIAGLYYGSKTLRQFAMGALAVFTAAGIYLFFIADYSYGFYKILLYSYFLVPILFAAGTAGLEMIKSQPLKKLITAGVLLGWLPLVGLVHYRFLRSEYDTVRHAFYNTGQGPGKMMETFAALKSVEGVVKPGERTLQLIQEDYYNKWASYFFRQPVGLYYIGDFFSVIHGRTLPNESNYDYVLANKHDTSFRRAEDVLFENDLLVFSKAQTFISFEDKGWYEWENVGGKRARWMKNASELLAFSKEADRVAIGGTAYWGPDRQSKTLTLKRDGVVVAAIELKADKTAFTFPPVELKPGFQKLAFEVTPPYKPRGADPRELSLLFEPLTIATQPALLSTRNPQHLSLIGNISPDGWVLDGGIKFALPVQPNTPSQLMIRGDVPGLSAALPQELVVDFGSGKRSVTIDKGGNFAVSVPMDATPKDVLEVTLKPSKSFVPLKLGINQDPRALAFHLDTLELKSR